MKTSITLLAVIVVILFPACSSTNVTTDYDHQANFTKYKTFGWMQSPAGNPPMPNRPLLRKHIENSVTEVLTAKGIEQSTGAPDLFVAFHSGVKDKIDVTRWGYGYGRWGRGVEVRQYKQGTLIIDLIDASTKELVWRGVGKSEITNEDREEQIKQVVSDILAKYPPAE